MSRILSPHDPEWTRAYETEASEIAVRFGGAVRAIHHIGSTAVDGLVAKPVIDILVEAENLAEIDAAAGGMAASGYEVRGEYGIPGRRYFSRPGFHVHVYAAESPDIQRHLAFRDYLRASPEAAAAYAALKLSLADSHGNLPQDYPDQKADFVAELQKAALEKYSGS